MKPLIKRSGQFLASGLVLVVSSACSLLQPAATPPPNFYALEGVSGKAALVASASAPTLIVSPPHAAAGFDSQRMIYQRAPYQLEYFAHSEWLEPPARLLAPLIVAAMAQTGAFRAVVLTPSTAAGDLRLDSEIIRLQQDFRSRPGTVRFTLRATLIEEKTRQVIASREFDQRVETPSEDPAGGVMAANFALQATLENLAIFAAETAHNLPKQLKY
jgi:cholesterol transport system auxiliary component